MSAIINQMQPRAVVLPAGVETDLFFDAEGLDTDGADSVQVTLVLAAGAPTIETISRYETSLTLEDVDPTNFGPVTGGGGGARKTITFDDVRGKSMRLTGTSTTGTTATVEAVVLSRST